MNVSNNQINITNIPANAMDQSTEGQRFEEEFDKNIEELGKDLQVTEVTDVEDSLLSNIKRMKDQITKIKHPEFLDQSIELLNSKIITLIQLINSNGSDKTRNALRSIFANVESSLFNQQIKLINDHLNKS